MCVCGSDIGGIWLSGVSYIAITPVGILLLKDLSHRPFSLCDQFSGVPASVYNCSYLLSPFGVHPPVTLLPCGETDAREESQVGNKKSNESIAEWLLLYLCITAPVTTILVYNTWWYFYKTREAETYILGSAATIVSFIYSYCSITICRRRMDYFLGLWVSEKAIWVRMYFKHENFCH